MKVVSNQTSHYNGRILVMWDPNMVEVTLVEESSQSLHCWVKSYNSGFQFSCTFIYIPSKLENCVEAYGRTFNKKLLV